MGYLCVLLIRMGGGPPYFAPKSIRMNGLGGAIACKYQKANELLLNINR